MFDKLLFVKKYKEQHPVSNQYTVLGRCDKLTASMLNRAYSYEMVKTQTFIEDLFLVIYSY